MSRFTVTRAAVVLVALLLLGLPSVASAGDWVIECVDCPPQFDAMTNRSLQLDADGLPHIAFGGNFLFYSRNDGAGWDTEIVDPSTNAGRYASLALDAAGRAHIAYQKGYGDAQLRYAVQTDEGWQIEIVDEDVLDNEPLSMALDSDGQPHIAYLRFGDQGSELVYAVRDVAGWHGETVAETSGHGPSLALDIRNRPHLAWDRGYGLTYAYRDGGWHMSEITDEESLNTSIAVEPNGRPQISFADWSSGHVGYGYRDNKGWHIETVDDEEQSHWTSLAVDATGAPHVAYLNSNSDELRYAVRGPDGWAIEPIAWTDAAFSLTNSPLLSLALSADGRPSVAYYDDAHHLKYLYFSSQWREETVVTQSDVGLNTELAIDDRGDVAISYRAGDQDLKVARQTPSGWTRETVESLGEVGGYTDIALDRARQPHVVYCAACDTTSNLKYAYRDGSGWHRETVAAGAYDAALALDTADRPHVVYMSADWDAMHFALIYAYRDGSDWHPETVAENDTGFGGLNIALDVAGAPAVAYVTEEQAIFFARRTAEGWDSETVDQADEYYYMLTPSLAMDAAGTPHLCYTIDFDEYGPGAVTYAVRDDDGWRREVVGDNNALCAVAVDAFGRAHVAFTTDTEEATFIRHGVRDASGWRFQELADTAFGRVGLAVDPYGLPHLSYGWYGIRHASLTPARTVLPVVAR